MRLIKHHKIPRSLIFWRDEEIETLSEYEHGKKHLRIYEMLKEMGFDLHVKIQVDENLWLSIPTYPVEGRPSWKPDIRSESAEGELREVRYDSRGRRVRFVFVDSIHVRFLPLYFVRNATVIELN